MVFGAFRTKDKKAQKDEQVEWLLSIDADELSRFVLGLLKESEPGCATMCVVALQNLPTLLGRIEILAERNPEAVLPTNFEGLLRLLSNEDGVDEIGRRRQAWWKWALLISRSTALAELSPGLRNNAGATWSLLAEGGRHIKLRISENVLWEPSEKDWFDYIQTENEGVCHVLNHLMPRWLMDNTEITAFAARVGLKRAPDCFY